MKIKVPRLKPRFKNINYDKIVYSLSHNKLIIAVAIAVFLIGLNVFSQYFFFRFDLTENQIFSITDDTKSLISELDQQVTITTYYSENLPPELEIIESDINAVLSQYERFSNGNVEVVSADASDSDFRTEALAEGLREVQFSELAEDRFEIATGFIGLTVSTDGESEAVPVITSVSNLEYDISSRINQLTRDESETIAFVAGQQEKDLNTSYQTISELLQVQFETTTVNLIEEEGMLTAEEYPILVIAGPQSEFSDESLFKLDQYMLSGGKLIVLLDQFLLEPQTTALNPNPTNIDEFVQHYGIEVNNNVLLDESFLSLGSGFSQVSYPYWVLTQSENIDQDIPALNGIESIAFFWASSLADATEKDSDREYNSLVSTTENAWQARGEILSADPSTIPFPAGEQQYTIAAITTGPATSYFADREIPIEGVDFQTNNEDVDLLVVGDSDFLSNDYIQGSEQNPAFFINMVESLSNADTLADIRSKNVVTRPLRPVTATEKNVVRFSSIALVPAALVAVGFGYNLYRSRRKSLI